LNLFYLSKTKSPQKVDVLNKNAHTMKYASKNIRRNACYKGTITQAISTPIRIKKVGKIMETTALKDLKVVMAFLKKTALNCRVKE
jgi:hypothetical protein